MPAMEPSLIFRPFPAGNSYGELSRQSGAPVARMRNNRTVIRSGNARGHASFLRCGPLSANIERQTGYRNLSKRLVAASRF